MLDGGHGHARRVHTAGERFDVRENFRGKFGGDLRCARGTRVHNSDKLRVGKVAIHTRMISPEVSGADNRNADFVWAGSPSFVRTSK